MYLDSYTQFLFQMEPQHGLKCSSVFFFTLTNLLVRQPEPRECDWLKVPQLSWQRRDGNLVLPDPRPAL